MPTFRIPKPPLMVRNRSSAPSPAPPATDASSLFGGTTSMASSTHSFLVGPASQLRAPSSLLAGALPSSLLRDADAGGDAGVDRRGLPSHHPPHPPPHRLGWEGGRTTSSIAARPRRLWTIQDACLRSIPPGFPPLNPNCTTYVGDASPSVVAVRISECLRKRSLAVEYDDEAATATVLSVDRCQFQVQLWKGTLTARADFRHGVVVECIRIQGSPLSFYPACRAILQAAVGQSTGDDRRPLRRTNGQEFRGWQDPPRPTTPPSEPTSPRPHVAAAQALEEARELLAKDRLDTQLLGMERLIHLTTPSICGKDTGLYVSVQLLQPRQQTPTGTDVTCWLVDQATVPDGADQDPPVSFTSSALDSNLTHSTIGEPVSPEEGRHASRMRALALRVLCNALDHLGQARLLGRVLQPKSRRTTPHPLQSRSLWTSLVSDLKGADRPPSVVLQDGGQSLASVHEAALACRILRTLGEHDPTVQAFLESELVLERLELARTCGRATHLILQQESERVYTQLTEDARSC